MIKEGKFASKLIALEHQLKNTLDWLQIKFFIKLFNCKSMYDFILIEKIFSFSLGGFQILFQKSFLRLYFF